jgi:hypothetical protein
LRREPGSAVPSRIPVHRNFRAKFAVFFKVNPKRAPTFNVRRVEGKSRKAGSFEP